MSRGFLKMAKKDFQVQLATRVSILGESLKPAPLSHFWRQKHLQITLDIAC